jgi:hypothetical protein
MPIDNLAQAGGNGSHRRIPGHRLETSLALATGAPHWLHQSGLWVTPDAVVGDGAFAAEGAAAHGMIGITEHLGDGIVPLDDDDPAGVIAIPWTGRADGGLRLAHGQSFLPGPLCHHEISHDYWILGMIQISMAHMTNAGFTTCLIVNERSLTVET